MRELGTALIVLIACGIIFAFGVGIGSNKGSEIKSKLKIIPEVVIKIEIIDGVSERDTTFIYKKN